MPGQKFIVPQFIDKENKILGPITVRQFLISIGTFFLIFIEYKLFTFGYFILGTIITAGIGGVFGFVKINGQPFHIFFLNFIQTSFRPKLRVWDKKPDESELRARMKPQVQKVIPPTEHKKAPPSTRLRELALTVNTGGVYRPESEE
jgi:hypothetical protein